MPLLGKPPGGVRDPHVRDLSAWEAEAVTVGYGDDVAGRGPLGNRIARLIGRALRDTKDGGVGRADVAKRMSDQLGRPVSVAQLDKWASEAADEHRIPLDAFVALMRAKTGAMSKEALMTALYGLEPDVEDKIIDVWACKLRKKLAAAGVAVEIETVWGQGYRLTAEGRAALKASLAGPDGSAAERREAEMRAAIDELAARSEALIAENQRLLAQLADPPVGAKPTASEKGWRRFAKARQPRRVPVLPIRGGASWPLI